MPRKTKLENCISRALYLIDTEPHTNLSPNRKRALYSDIHCLLEWAKDDLSPTGRWYTQPSSNLRGHHVYYDDIRGPDHSRYLITPIATKTGRFSRY